MIWDKKYTPWVPEIICPVCQKRLDRKEWEDFGMHFHCTEYFISGRYYNEIKGIKEENCISKSFRNS